MKQTLGGCALLLLVTAWVVRLVAAAPANDPKAAVAFFTDTRTHFAQRPDFEGTWTINPDRKALVKTYDEDNPAEFIARSGE